MCARLKIRSESEMQSCWLDNRGAFYIYMRAWPVARRIFDNKLGKVLYRIYFGLNIRQCCTPRAPSSFALNEGLTSQAITMYHCKHTIRKLLPVVDCLTV